MYGDRMLYELLEVHQTASFEEIRQNYLRKCMSTHPDKSNSEESKTLFQQVQGAWETLRDPVLRMAYDRNLKGTTLNEKPVNEEVDLGDMTPLDEGTWFYPCRCGEFYTITTREMENSVHVTPCPGCSLCIHVTYEVCEEL
eukprot:TRINITY_DN4601_c0_g1_i3.p1 TRINITY_DN4601_c0_g1~~TRINITY_DN4601_c0_g1_i3.p1  ORF type:complete len:141 (-),score=14.23 TRINITY_DN4601_c0_g1_i3:121-543(-)